MVLFWGIMKVVEILLFLVIEKNYWYLLDRRKDIRYFYNEELF